MNFLEGLSRLNYWAVLTAALSAFVIGGAWYSPALFKQRWMAANKFEEADLKRGNVAVIFAGSFTLALISALAMALFIGRSPSLSFGVMAGVLVGLCWVGMSFGITYLFERRPFILFLINAGYHLVTFTVMGIILGLWHR